MSKLSYGFSALIILSIFTVIRAEIKQYYNAVRAVKVITGSLPAGSNELLNCYNQCGVQYCDDHCKQELEYFSNLANHINSGTAYYIDNTYDYIDNPNDLTDCLIKCETDHMRFIFDIRRPFLAISYNTQYECETFEKCWANNASDQFNKCYLNGPCITAVQCVMGHQSITSIQNCMNVTDDGSLADLLQAIKLCYEDEKLGYSFKLTKIYPGLSINPDDD
jgi:hypothetical protein